MDFPPNVWTWPTGSPLFRSLSCLSWDVMCVCNYWSWAAGRHRAGRGRDDIVSQRPLLHGSTTRHTESTQTSRTVKRLPDGYLNGSPSVEREEGRKELILICPLINMIHAFPWQALWKVYSWKRSIGLYLHIFPRNRTPQSLCVIPLWVSGQNAIIPALSVWLTANISLSAVWVFSSCLTATAKRQFSSFLHPADLIFITFFPLGSSFHDLRNFEKIWFSSNWIGSQLPLLKSK